MKTYDLSGLVTIRVTGDAALERALDQAFGPYRSDTTPDLVLEAGARPAGPLRSLGRSPVAVAGDRTYVVDHLGRAADFPIRTADADEVVVRVERGFYPTTFYNRVLQPLLRLRLAFRREVVMLHGMGVGIGGHPVVGAGWSGTGKTTAMLRLLADGATYFGNDWVLVGRDGTMYPYSLQLNLYARTLAGIPELAEELPVSMLRGFRWMRRAEHALQGASRVIPWAIASRGIAEIAKLVGSSAPLGTSIDRVIEDFRVGRAAPLDTFVLLEDVRSPVIETSGWIASRVLTNLRYESVNLWADSLGATYALGGAATVDRLFEAEEAIVTDALANTRCVRAAARDLHRVVSAGRTSSVTG